MVRCFGGELLGWWVMCGLCVHVVLARPPAPGITLHLSLNHGHRGRLADMMFGEA